MKKVKLFLFSILITLVTTACAHHPHHHHSHGHISYSHGKTSSRVIIVDENFLLDFSYGNRRRYSRNYRYHRPHNSYHGRTAITCRGPWLGTTHSYNRDGVMITSANRSCIIPISPLVKTATYQPATSYISGNWCVQQMITRLNVYELSLREHRFSPPINCFR